MESEESGMESEEEFSNPFSQEISPFEYRNRLSNSTILQAVAENDIEKVQELINAGKSVSVVDNNGCSALHVAIGTNSNEMVQLLLKHEINIDHQNFLGNTPLLFALKYGSRNSIIIQLLEFGCNVNIKNKRGKTALHLAVICYSPEIIQLLIEHGADINSQDAYYLFTPLHQAAHFNKFPAVCTLLYYNADPNMLCYNNFTPFVYPLMNLDSFEITEILFHYYDEFIPVTEEQYLYILQQVFLIENLQRSDWVDYFYLLVEVGFKNQFESVLKDFFWYFHKNKIDLNIRKCILWTFLSLGVNVERSSLLECCLLFGNGDELEILYQCYNPPDLYNIVLADDSSPPLHYFEGMLNSSAHYLKLRLESSYWMYLLNLFELIKLEQSIDNQFYLGYMSFSPGVLKILADIDYGDHQNLILQTILLLPKVPSLLELSRNASAVQIVSTFNIKRPYQFFDVVNRANLPKFVKELLLFRTPVYYV